MQKAFGYTFEEYKTSILPMAQNGSEPIEQWGTDSPLPMLSDKPQPLFNYFKQLFAQNQPNRSIRSVKIVTSTSVYIGEDGNLLVEDADNCKVLKIRNPILTDTDMLKIKYINKEGFKSEVLPITYYKNTF